MIIKEYRLVLPMSVEEYQVGQLWSVAEASKNETGGGEGVEIVKNEPYDNHPLLNGKFTKGQYTHKIYHLASKVPAIVRLIAPKGSLEVHEEAWNAYPYCKTVITNPGYMKDKFRICIETMHLPDKGETENAHELLPPLLKKREVVMLDITDDTRIPHNDYREEIDPKKWRSVKTCRGPLVPGTWMQTTQPIMCAYKLVTIDFVWFGLQGKIERYVTGPSVYPRLFTKFHREVVCWMDKWHGMTMEEIRALEEAMRVELDENRRKGSIRGMKPQD